MDYRKYAEYHPRFADEFGYQAPPAFSTLVKVVHDDPLDPFGEQMLIHQKASNGNYKLARGMRGHLTSGCIDDISYDTNGMRDWLIDTDHWENIEDWHWACQLQQAQAVRFGVEHMRSLEPINAGTLIWQLNDDWPVVSWAAVDYYGHRKPLWYASKAFFAPRFATIQPRVSEQAKIDRSWEGGPVAADMLALIVINDTHEPWQGAWHIERRTLAGEILASQSTSASLEITGHTILRLNDDVATFNDASKEIIVATPSDETFNRVILNGSEVIDQALVQNPLTSSAKADNDGYTITVKANAYARDVFCMVDKVDEHAKINGGMVTLLPGESVTWHIESQKLVDPSLFTRPNVLRCANDLKR